MASKTIHSETEITTIVEEVISMLPQKDSANVITLTGDLGAGKTSFTKALARQLGVTEHVTSPTFVLMKSYAISEHSWIQELVHIDAYRIEDIDEVRVLRLEELYAKEGTVICIEWPEKIQEVLPSQVFQIAITIGEGDERTITYGD